MKTKKTSLLIGVIILSVFIIMALCPSLFSSYGRKEMFGIWISPCMEHIFGTNSLGYDIWTELVYAAKDTLVVALLSSVVSIALALVFALLASLKGTIGRIFSGIIRVFLTVPKLICLIVLSAYFGNSELSLILIISVFSFAASAKVLEARIQVVNSKPFIDNLIVQGFSKTHIALRHVLPNMLDVILTRFILGLNSCIMMESTLSFLGFGSTYYPTWGSMINFAYTKGAMIRGAYSYLIAPGFCIVLVSLSIYLITIYIDSRKDEI